LGTYRERYPGSEGRVPALIPQVYLHYDPYTARELKTVDGHVLARQRMDFLLLLSERRRVVIEVDGQHHYSADGKPSSRLYSGMVAEDRRIRLAGYEVYRFGGWELMQPDAPDVLRAFFDELLA
jgi:very-short-patch-repair endonuclease